MDAQQQIFSLMAMAEEHQKAATAELERLAAERAALAKERAALGQAAQGIQKAIGDAVAGAVAQSLAGASQTAVAAFTKAAGPFTLNVQGAADHAGAAAAEITQAARWLGIKAVAVAAGCVVVVAVAAWGFVAWERHEVSDLSAQQAALQTNIEQMQANVAALKREGGNIVTSNCGGRLCIEASSNQGSYSNGTPIPLGTWTTTKGNIPLVIPRGY